MISAVDTNVVDVFAAEKRFGEHSREARAVELSRTSSSAPTARR